MIFGLIRTTEEKAVPSPLGDKMRALRKEKKLSLEQLAELTESSKSYIWELENKDVPNPSADKIGRIAAALEVTPEFLLDQRDDLTPDDEIVDEAFFRRYRKLEPDVKKKIRKIMDAFDDE
jgi:transcriptional regulator with XRE-family HTH domain